MGTTVAAKALTGKETATTIAQVEGLIKYQFTNKDLLCEALMLPGSYKQYPDGNRRLAIVGDKALDLAFSMDWYLYYIDTDSEDESQDGSGDGSEAGSESDSEDCSDDASHSDLDYDSDDASDSFPKPTSCHYWDQGIRRTALCNANLACVAQQKGLFKCLDFPTMGDSSLKEMSVERKATYLEAVMGAAILDGGIGVVYEVAGTLEIEDISLRPKSD